MLDMAIAFLWDLIGFLAAFSLALVFIAVAIITLHAFVGAMRTLFGN